MPQSVTLKCRGLYSFPNALSEQPEGALNTADNVVIDREGVISSRRGFKLYGGFIDDTSSSARAKQLLVYKGRILRHWNTTLEVDSNGSGTFTSISSSVTEAETGLRIKGIEANGNFYFTTSAGIKKLSVTSAAGLASASVSNAGIPKALDLATTPTTDITGFLPTNTSTAYRIAWGIKDANQNVITGAPSSRSIVRNSSGSTQRVDLTFVVPDGITTTHFYQIFRTVTTSSSSADPGDEMQLVIEDTPTSAEITAKLISVSDVTPEDFLGTFLYTNANSGEGILQSNEVIPFAKDIALFRQCTFLANTATRYRKIITLLGVSDITSNVSTLIVKDSSSTETYTFRTTADGGEDSSTKKVLLSTSGTPAQNVDDTARSLVRVINRQSNGLVYAYYLSGDNESDLPGKILLEGRSLGALQFEILVDSDTTTGEAFNPNLPDSGSGFQELSDNEVAPNRIFFSKSQQPEAVPLVNFLDVGAKDKKIFRIVPLRDSLFVLKEDGIFRISGDSPTNFFSSLFDSSANCKAPDTAAILNNQIYLFSDQGIVTISDTGVSIISRPIEDLLLPLTSYTNFATASFAVGYESDRSYLLWTITESADTTATQCYRYNTFTNTWTRLNLTKTCAVVNQFNDRLYLGADDTPYIEEERKSFNRFDHADREFTVTLPLGGITENVLSLGALFDVEEGDVLVQTQYLTVAQFNRLLSKLDMDSGVADADYLSLLEAAAGDDLGDKLVLLVAKLNADTGVTDADYVATGSANFATVQTEFNTIVAKLNLDAGVTFSNYRTSSGTVEWEVYVDSINAFTRRITLGYAVPFIEGSITVYKHIPSTVTWAPHHFGDASLLKQVRESTMLFENQSFSKATAAFGTDLSPGFHEIDFLGEGTGSWGNFTFGNNTWGGEGSSKSFRTYVPREKQRCRYISARFEHAVAFEEYSIFGVSFTFEPTSPRGYR